MNGPFQGSRLSNLREKRPFQNVTSTKQQQKPLTLQLDDQPAYQPSINIQAGRTATRFLKGRIQRPSTIQKPAVVSSVNEGLINKENNNIERKPTLKLSQPQQGDLKLVLNDSPQFDKKKPQIKIAPTQPIQKRVLIQKKEQKQQPKQPQVKPQVKKQVQPVKAPVNKVQEQVISVKKNQDNKIKEEQVEQSKDGLQNQNQLVQCPEGCGRKFNRKALQKHAKACKLVFMSKRKQFNSEAKRLTSQQQAALIKQNKLQEKKAQMGMTKTKGFQKTGENWKAASEDFRSALKAIKKQGAQKQGDQQGQEQLKTVACEYCQKQFAQVLLGKHLQNCVKKKQKQLKQKKKGGKKK